jgi:hypothetical protein
MEKMVGFVKLYFPVFLLGAVFGKLIEFRDFHVPLSPPPSTSSVVATPSR